MFRSSLGQILYVTPRSLVVVAVARPTRLVDALARAGRVSTGRVAAKRFRRVYYRQVGVYKLMVDRELLTSWSVEVLSAGILCKGPCL